MWRAVLLPSALLALDATVLVFDDIFVADDTNEGAEAALLVEDVTNASPSWGDWARIRRRRGKDNFIVGLVLKNL
jgi:hypothetical protein